MTDNSHRCRTGRIMPTQSQTGRVVIITGASSGIGRCAAVLFGRKGWQVGLISRGRAGLESIHSDLTADGVRCATATADVADGSALEAAAAALEAELGPIAIWVNCAGNGTYGPFMSVPEEDFRRVTDVTYMGTVNGTRVALRRMIPRDEGAVVNICSAIAFHALPVLSSYSGAKHAVRGFTQSVRHELAETGSRVRLVTVYPPAVNTPFFSHANSTMPLPPRPVRPVYQPEVVADAILLAATSRRQEVRVSGITVLFSLACKLVPGLVHHAIQRLGSEGQMTDDPEAARRRHSTLFSPSLEAAGAHGPFGNEARRRSAQMWISRHRVRLAVGCAALCAAALAIRWWA